jgi:uncharacterized Ntn-hydrolase superfamily protein
MTYSIIARDPATSELGIAVQSRYFAAGRTVPWIEAGIGAVASQGFANPMHGPEALRLLRAGVAPQASIEQLLSRDAGAAQRQVAILDLQGRVAVHTGDRCVAAAGHAIGTNCCAQANMMARDTVWQAMVQAFEVAPGELADRLIAAMDAAEREGGDLRGKQAAALIVVAGQPSGVPQLDHPIDLRVDDHPDPISELKRLLRYSRAHQLANRALHKISATDFPGALSDLDVCCAEFPDEPEFLVRRSMVVMALGRMNEARATLQRAYAVQPGAGELLLRFADAGVIPVSRAMLQPLVAGLAAGT